MNGKVVTSVFMRSICIRFQKSGSDINDMDLTGSGFAELLLTQRHINTVSAQRSFRVPHQVNFLINLQSLGH
jgi:hypothetical protein